MEKTATQENGEGERRAPSGVYNIRKATASLKRPVINGCRIKT